MAEPAQDPALLLREDLSKEYSAILNVVSNYDGWLHIVKGWSVTLYNRQEPVGLWWLVFPAALPGGSERSCGSTG